MHAIAHLADDGHAGMQPDAEAQGLRQIMRQQPVERRETARDLARRSKALALAGGCCSSPSTMRMRQVEQRPRPPHTEACGMRAERLASSTVMPRGMRTSRPSG